MGSALHTAWGTFLVPFRAIWGLALHPWMHFMAEHMIVMLAVSITLVLVAFLVIVSSTGRTFRKGSRER